MTDLAALFAVLRGVPHLPGAACRGQWELFDLLPGTSPDRDDLAAQALATCRRHCPALADCGQWFDSLPPKHRPVGVIAGRINERNFR